MVKYVGLTRNSLECFKHNRIKDHNYLGCSKHVIYILYSNNTRNFIKMTRNGLECSKHLIINKIIKSNFLFIYLILMCTRIILFQVSMTQTSKI